MEMQTLPVNKALAMGSLAGPIMSVQCFGINVLVTWYIHAFAVLCHYYERKNVDF